MDEEHKFSSLARFGFYVAVISALAALLSAAGTHWNLWDFVLGLKILRWAAYVGLAAAIISLAGSIITIRHPIAGGFIWAILGLFISGVVVVVPWYWWQKAKSLPPIHDITTDLDNPPQFVAILSLRKDAPNPSEYGGPAIAEQQRAAYPDIAPLYLQVSPDAAYDEAITIARRLGWRIVNDKKTQGHIEAVDTTFWFGFKDDIVIRIEKANIGSRIDIRSVSRVGRSDLGTNAERIRRFLKEMQAI